MNYFEDMMDRGGFRNGCAVPSEAYMARDIYIKVINLLAEKFNSGVRAIPYESFTHNPCRILFVRKEIAQREPALLQDSDICAFDAEMWDVMYEIDDEYSDLDAYYETKVIVNTGGLETILANIKKS